ncbi:MAG: ATP-dependent RNA helicase HrpA [Woeseiaceae bacterium]
MSTLDPRSSLQTLMLREQFLSQQRTLSAEQLAESSARLESRQAWQPDETPDTSLPIEARRDEVIDALRSHQVVVVSGETGSGKTTQLPRYALAAGFGRRGMIGHTQPRRIAARSVASRIAEQTGSKLGEHVGYGVRFDDKSNPDTLVKLMTDGLLLSEFSRDKLLLAYEVIIIDEAHERSLNIDFLIGLLATILPRRPDLRVIITSATIDHERFAAHFGDAPVIEVSGRGYPVETRYDENGDSADDSRVLARRVCEAVKGLQSHRFPKNARDILVFLPGEREIRDCEKALVKSGRALGDHWEILPLFGRLSDDAQNRVFRSSSARRIVLATNVAETSLTVPRIGAVIDSGLARVSRYSARSRVQRLQLEPISIASANQRAGRCGRLGPGVCVRLYDEADFDQRAEFTDAEIIRTNLASVVLQMAALRLSEVEDFPFLDKPDVGQIDDARRLLFELGALDSEERLTKLGRWLAQVPLDPRLGRMLWQLDKSAVSEWAIIVVAGLSIQDPRQRPLEQASAADDAHAKFADEASDFATLANIWRHAEQARKEQGRSAYERWCQSRFLSVRRLREWREVAGQLAKQLKIDIRALDIKRAWNEKESLALHQRFLQGLLSQVGTHAENGEYEGAARRRFRLHPASVLSGRTPKWVMALEIVQTQKRFARSVATIDSQWLVSVGSHLLQFDYDKPYWNARKGRVEAKRTSLLFGLVVRANERVDYGTVDPFGARDVFLREGLVADRVRLKAPFVMHNRQEREALASLEGRLRRPLEIREVDFAALYAKQLPESVIDVGGLKRWLKKDAKQRNQRLSFSRDELMADEDSSAAAELPTTHQVGGNRLKIDYQFTPAAVEHDGASIRIPRALLTALRRSQVDAAVPEYLARRVEARLRRLPKARRKQLQPLADNAKKISAQLIREQERGSLDERLTRLMLREYAMDVSVGTWDDVVEQPFWRPRVVIIDDQGKTLASSRDLTELQAAERRKSPAQQTTKAATKTQAPARDWQFGHLPTERQSTSNGVTLTLYPALKVVQSGVVAHDFLDGEQGRSSHDQAVTQLLAIRMSQPLKQLRKQLLGQREVALLWAAFEDPGASTLIDDVQTAALQHAFGTDFQTVRSDDAFDLLVSTGAADVVNCGNNIQAQLLKILKGHSELRNALAKAPTQAQEATADVGQQVAAMVFPGFLSRTPADRLADVPRYLAAAKLRLERFASNPSRDHESMAMIKSLISRLERLRGLTVGPEQASAVDIFRWQIEELRVSLFAQTLGTKEKVSLKRLEKRWDVILRMQG